MPDFQTPSPDAPAPTHSAPGETIIDVTTESFMAEVIEASNEQLVLLDLWAPWCGPCKQLTPVLEKLTAQADGAVRLAKMNIDEHPAVAQQLKVQSIPAVFAFKAGRPVDGFMGALPESELAAFIDKHLDGALAPSAAEALMETAAEMLAAEQYDDALECYQAAQEQEPDNIKAMAGLAQTHLAMGAIEQAAGVLAAAPQDAQAASDRDLTAARAALALAQKVAEKVAEKRGENPAAQSGQSGDIEGGAEIENLLAAIAADGNNHQARFDVALAYHAAGRHDAAMTALLDSIEIKRDWNEQAARKQLLELFDAYGANDELVVAARRRLSSILFS